MPITSVPHAPFITQYVTEAPDLFSLTNKKSLQYDEVRACLNVHAERRSYHISFDRFLFVLAGKQNSSFENGNTEMTLPCICLEVLKLLPGYSIS